MSSSSSQGRSCCSGSGSSRGRSRSRTRRRSPNGGRGGSGRHRRHHLGIRHRIRNREGTHRRSMSKAVRILFRFWVCGGDGERFS